MPNGYRRTFYNVLPKSGTHLVRAHRDVPPHNHVPLYLNLDNTFPIHLKPGSFYIKEISKIKGDFSGHIPYSAGVRDYLEQERIWHVFVFRDLRDVAVSLAWYVKNFKHIIPDPHETTEFNVRIDNTHLALRPDITKDSIMVVAEWWRVFKPWVRYANTVFTYEELRPAAFLCGNEDTITFHNGRINNWAHTFSDHHKKLAQQLLPDVMPEYFSGRIIDEK